MIADGSTSTFRSRSDLAETLKGGKVNDPIVQAAQCRNPPKVSARRHDGPAPDDLTNRPKLRLNDMEKEGVGSFHKVSEICGSGTDSFSGCG